VVLDDRIWWLMLATVKSWIVDWWKNKRKMAENTFPKDRRAYARCEHYVRRMMKQ